MAREIPVNDLELLQFGKQFNQTTAVNHAELGVTPAQAAALGAAYAEYDAALKHHRKLQAEAIAATTAKEAAKQAFSAKCRSIVHIARGNEAPSNLLIELGVGTIERATVLHPHQPEDLTVIPDASGTNLLRWNPGGNKKRTVYLVEVKHSGTQGWQIIGTTTKRTFRHQFQRPGFTQSYRIRAVRSGTTGIPSFTATVYPALSPGSEMAA